MEQTTLIKEIKLAAAKLKDGKLKGMNNILPTLEYISHTLDLNGTDEAMVFVAIFDRNCEENGSNISDLANYYGCSILEMMEYQPCLPSLVEQGVISHTDEDEFRIQRMNYGIHEMLFEDICNGKPLRKRQKVCKEYNNYDLVSAAHKLFQARSSKSISTEKMLRLLADLEEKHDELDIVIAVKQQVGTIESRAIFYEVCNDKMGDFDRGTSSINSTLNDIFDSREDCARLRSQILDGSHELIVCGLIEVLEENEMTISTKALPILFGEYASSFRKKMVATDRYDFVKKIDEQVSQIDRSDRFGRRTNVNKLIEIEEKNAGLPFVAALKKVVTDFNYRVIFYMIARKLVKGYHYGINELNEIFTKNEEIIITRRFKDETTILQTTGLAEVSKCNIFNNSVLILTDKGKELFLEEDADLFVEKAMGQDFISHEKIAHKQLYFDSSLQRQLSLVTDSLDNESYQQMVTRLREKNLPTGVAILLYGLPGTGKTESVMQIAKQTGRDIMHVDISSTKSCWFGESEKLIKDVFDSYKRLCNKSKVTPILLFNEADAIFSKRKDNNSSNVAQTENAIQNIILEEMEKLDGILIATTNLAENLDKAFERRFLFKIQFDRPTIEAKSKIWLNKLPSLGCNEADQLASQFDFCGGEIDNIVRKATMDEVVYGTAPSYEMLVTLCKEEKIGKQQHNKIGF